jgi:hypothetical protein
MKSINLLKLTSILQKLIMFVRYARFNILIRQTPRSLRSGGFVILRFLIFFSSTNTPRRFENHHDEDVNNH